MHRSSFTQICLRTRSRLLLTLAVSGWLVGCGTDSGDTPQQAAAEPRLPVRTSEMMASLINQHADPLWSAMWRNPQTNDEWRELEQQARQLQLGGALLPVPGTGPMDGEWAADSDWTNYSQQLQAVAGRAVTAAQARDMEGITRIGAEIVQVCNGCHSTFAPSLPTVNLTMPPFMPQ